jgi:hypothetical protein
MPRRLSLILALVVVFALPSIASATDYDRRYHWGQGMAWASLASIPIGMGAVVASASRNPHTGERTISWYGLPGFGPAMAAPLAMSLGTVWASGALSNMPRCNRGLKRGYAWGAIGLVTAAVGLTGLGPVSVAGPGSGWVIAGVYSLALFPATAQLLHNREHYVHGGDEPEGLEQLDELDLDFGLAPVITRDQRGLALLIQF